MAAPWPGPEEGVEGGWTSASFDKHARSEAGGISGYRGIRDQTIRAGRMGESTRTDATLFKSYKLLNYGDLRGHNIGDSAHSPGSRRAISLCRFGASGASTFPSK